MEQQDLFGTPMAPEPVVAPVPSARPYWTPLAPRGVGSQRCSHCVLVAGQVEKPPKIRTAVAIRMGVLGDTMVLCAGHRDLQRATDRRTWPEE